jgi:hypothetical protein
MRHLTLATCGLLSLGLAQSQALADATIAIAQPADDNGWAMGVSFSAPNQSEADAVALDNCLKQREETGIQAECRIVARYDNMCMAVAKDTAASGTAWGWGTASGQGDADDTALANCRQFAGARADYCEVTMRHCDGE